MRAKCRGTLLVVGPEVGAVRKRRFSVEPDYVDVAAGGDRPPVGDVCRPVWDFGADVFTRRRRRNRIFGARFGRMPRVEATPVPSRG